MNPLLPANPGEDRRNMSTARIALFWTAMILLAVLLWKMSSKPQRQQTNQSFTSTELQNQIDSKNIRSAHITVYHDRALVIVERRDTPARFQAYVSNDFVPKIIRQLEENGADVWVQGETETANNWAEFLFDGAPFILLLVLFIIVVRQKRTRTRGDAGRARPIDV
jgi:ATP-dependent Zn protease